MIRLTEEEQMRLVQIRLSMKKFKREGRDIKDWESPFLLGILDKFIKESRKTLKIGGQYGVTR